MASESLRRELVEEEEENAVFRAAHPKTYTESSFNELAIS